MSKAPFSVLDYLYKHYHKDAGKMLIHTGVISWILSSAAQIFGIMINDKIPKEQKMYIVPQEFADAVFNIISFYLVTRSFSSLANVLTSTGKWIPSNVKNHLIKNGFKNRIGKLDFNIADLKLKGSPKRSFELFSNGIGMAAATIGSVISCNIITPIFRNSYATYRQKTNLAKLNDINSNSNDSGTQGANKYKIYRTSLQSFMNRGSLKV